MSLDLIVIVVFLLQSDSPLLILVETKCWVSAGQILYGRLQTCQGTFDLHQSLKKLLETQSAQSRPYLVIQDPVR